MKIIEDSEGFCERLVKYRTIYQAFYGSFWYIRKIPLIYHIGWICLRYIAWRNSKIPTIAIKI